MLSTLLLIKSLSKRGVEEETVKITRKHVLGMVILFVLFIVYIVAMNLVGYLVVTPVFILAMMLISGSRKWVEMVITSIAVTALVYLVFQFVFRVQLPRIIFL